MHLILALARDITVILVNDDRILYIGEVAMLESDASCKPLSSLQVTCSKLKMDWINMSHNIQWSSTQKVKIKNKIK